MNYPIYMYGVLLLRKIPSSKKIPTLGVDILGNKNILDIKGYANIMGLIEESSSHTKSTTNQLDNS